MSSPRYATPLRLRLEPSPRMRAIFILFNALCVIALLLVQMPIGLKLLAVVVLAVVVLKTWRDRPELGGETAEVVLCPDGAWLLQRAGGEEKLQLHGQSTVSHTVMILVFSGEGKVRPFVLWRRELAEDKYRRLQVYLRMYAGEAVG